MKRIVVWTFLLILFAGCKPKAEKPKSVTLTVHIDGGGEGLAPLIISGDCFAAASPVDMPYRSVS